MADKILKFFEDLRALADNAIKEIKDEGGQTPVPEPEPEKPDKRIYMIGKQVGKTLLVNVSNFAPNTVFNWSVYRGDAYNGGQFIDGNNQGSVILDVQKETEVIELDLEKLVKKGAVPRGTTPGEKGFYRLYLAAYVNPTTESYMDFLLNPWEETEPTPEEPKSQLEILDYKFEGGEIEVTIGNYGEYERFNWSIYLGDGYNGGRMIDGNNQGKATLDLDDDLVVYLDPTKYVPRETYRMYVRAYDVKETEVYFDFEYKNPNDDTSAPRPEPEPDKPTENGTGPIVTPSNPEGELKARKLDFSKGINANALDQIGTYKLPKRAINITQSDVPWDKQVELVKSGRYNYIHVGKLMDELGGAYHPEWHPQGIKWEDLGKYHLPKYNLPKTTGFYRMMYANAFDHCYQRYEQNADGSYILDANGQKQDFRGAPHDLEAFYAVIEDYAVGLRNAIGWQDHPTLCDIDAEDGRFFTYHGVAALCEGIRRVRAKYPDVEFLVYASGPGNSSQDEGGGPDRPDKFLNSGVRFRMFYEAGVRVYQGTVPYFHFPSYSWNDPSHEPTIIGPGKMFPDQKTYARESLVSIYEHIGWTDAFWKNCPADLRPIVFEWYMAVMEGGDDGGERRFYVENGKQVPWTSFNWPEFAEWLQEAQVPISAIMGNYQNGGGGMLWTDSRPWNKANIAFEAGKERAYALADWIENPNTQFNIKLEFSLNRGGVWHLDTEKRGNNILERYSNPLPYARAARLGNQLWYFAVAGQPFHASAANPEGKSQSVMFTYGSKVWELDLKPRTVHIYVLDL